MDLNLESFMESVGVWFLSSGLRIGLITILALIVLKAVGVLTSRIEVFLGKKGADIEYQKRAKTLSSVVRWILRTVVVAVTFMMLLEELGVEVGPVIAAAGVVGLAVGFGAQNLVQDFISGFFLLLEDQIRVGDVVKINDKGGLVEQINLRMVILRDYSGNVIFIRNGKIDIVTNMTKDYSRYVFEVGVAYREDVDEVIQVLKGIDEEMRKDPAFKDDILEPLDVAGLDSFGNSAIVIKARITTKPIQQWRIGREFNRRIKKRFDELGIEIPFPHQTIYFGVDKEGNAPPMRIQTNSSAEKTEEKPG